MNKTKTHRKKIKIWSVKVVIKDSDPLTKLCCNEKEFITKLE